MIHLLFSSPILKAIWPASLIAVITILASLLCFLDRGQEPFTLCVITVAVSAAAVCGTYFWAWRAAYTSDLGRTYTVISNEWGRLISILITAGIFFFLFSPPEIRLKFNNLPISSLNECIEHPAILKECGTTKCKTKEEPRCAAIREVFTNESQMAGNEIAKRMDHIDEWFHYKFVLIGALIAVFLTHFARSDENNMVELERLLKSSLSCVVLSLASTVAIAVDIHIRNDVIAINQLGSWLAYYAEPFLSTVPFNDKSFLFWEKFLREDGVGMHTDPLYRFMFWPHLHFITWIIYAIYLWVFQNMCLTDEESESIQMKEGGTFSYTKKGPKIFPNAWIILATYGLVHMSLLAFALMTTLSPSQFELRPFPGVEIWTIPWTTTLVYGSVLFVLITIDAPYIIMLCSKCKTSHALKL